MSKSIWEILSPFANSESEEEPKESSEEEKQEESPPENKEKEQENSTSENKEEPQEESTSENKEEQQEESTSENKEEQQEASTPPENTEGTSSEETPPPEDTEETASSVESSLEPLLFRIIHKLMGCKIFVDLCKFILMILLGILLVLTYGQIQKPEGCASFETIFAQFEANKLCNYFIKGDMDKLTEYVHILTPADSYRKEWENDLRNQVSLSLSSLFQEKKLGKLAKKNNITCEYQKDKITGITHLIYTCHIQLNSKEEMKLVFQKDGKSNFQISVSSNGKNADTLETMTRYFTYLSNGYYRVSDYDICSLLCQKNSADYSILSKYFHKNADKNTKKDTLGKDFVAKFKSLLSKKIIFTDAVFTPYEYNKKTKKLSTCLILCFQNSSTNASGILYQPFTVGIYGYAPKGMGKLYSDSMDETVASQIQNLFSV